MSRAGVSRALVASVALAAATSLMSCTWKTSDRLLQEVAPYADSIRVKFSCNGVESLALVDPLGRPAWVFTRKPDDPITWLADSSVTINSIKSRPKDDSLPLDSAGTQGRTFGAPFQSRVKRGTPPKHYHYVIDATCRPATGPDVRLLIDPEMIVRKH